MKMQQLILHPLLDAYERSKAFRDGASGRRVQLSVSSVKAFAECFENADERRKFLAALSALADANLVSFSWVRFEKGNLVDKIYLSTEPGALSESYRICGRVDKAAFLSELERAIREAGQDQLPASDIRDWLLAAAEEIRTKRRLPVGFAFPELVPEFRPDTEPEAQARVLGQDNQNLLTFLCELPKIDGEELERVMSTRLFSDSKYFERVLRPRVLRILRDIAKKAGHEDIDDTSLLEERGIFKWPEILEFCGPVLVTLDDGSTIDYRTQVYGAYINAETLRHIKAVSLPGVTKLLTIENKANYTWYIRSARKPDELVLFHGGFLSPSRERWFRWIAEAIKIDSVDGRQRADNLSEDGVFDELTGCARNLDRLRRWACTEETPAAQASPYHSGDIDLGGFRMFRHLQEIFPSIRPWQMDVETLKRFASGCISIDSDSYRTQLARLLDDPSYEIFYETIRYMLAHNVRLEQEREISS